MLAGEKGGRGSSLCFFLLLFFLWLDVFERVKAAMSVFFPPRPGSPSSASTLLFASFPLFYSSRSRAFPLFRSLPPLLHLQSLKNAWDSLSYEELGAAKLLPAASLRRHGGGGDEGEKFSPKKDFSPLTISPLLAPVSTLRVFFALPRGEHCSLCLFFIIFLHRKVRMSRVRSSPPNQLNSVRASPSEKENERERMRR